MNNDQANANNTANNMSDSPQLKLTLSQATEHLKVLLESRGMKVQIVETPEIQQDRTHTITFHSKHEKK